MKKLLLGSLLAGEELDIVNKKNIYFPVAIAKIFRGLIANGINPMIDKSFRGDIRDFNFLPFSSKKMADGLHKMGLAQAYPPVDEERIISLSRRLGYSQGGRVGDIVTLPHDKIVKGVFSIEVYSPGRRVPGPEFFFFHSPFGAGRWSGEGYFYFHLAEGRYRIDNQV
jgi:hypothetical protein